MAQDRGHSNGRGPRGRNGPPRGGHEAPTPVLPLYREAHDAPPGLADTSHRGLWFDRFFNAYHWKDGKDGALDIDKSRRKKDEKSWQDRWLGGLAGEVGDPARLKGYAQRLAILAQAQGGDTREFQSEWNFVTGMGLPHPLENGLVFHPTLGVPYLPASGVKGLVRAFLRDRTDLDGQYIEDWFGPDLGGVPAGEQAERAAAGAFVFFDAVPVAPPTLAVDVMTPHMGKWYAEGGKIKADGQGHLPADAVPADWHDPIPIKFLAVKDIRLQFALAPRRRGVPNEADAREALFDALGQALSLLGAGAKTAAGYGRFGS